MDAISICFITQKHGTRLENRVFLQFQEQIVLAYSLEHFADMLHMTTNIKAMNDDVIQVYLDRFHSEVT